MEVAETINNNVEWWNKKNAKTYHASNAGRFQCRLLGKNAPGAASPDVPLKPDKCPEKVAKLYLVKNANQSLASNV